MPGVVCRSCMPCLQKGFFAMSVCATGGLLYINLGYLGFSNCKHIHSSRFISTGSPLLTWFSNNTKLHDFLNNTIYFGTLICPFRTKSLLRLHKVSKNRVTRGAPVHGIYITLATGSPSHLLLWFYFLSP